MNSLFTLSLNPVTIFNSPFLYEQTLLQHQFWTVENRLAGSDAKTKERI